MLACVCVRPVYFTKTTKKTYEFWGELRQYENGTKIRNSEAKNYGNQNASLVERTQRFRSVTTRMASPGIRSDHFDSATDLDTAWLKVRLVSVPYFWVNRTARAPQLRRFFLCLEVNPRVFVFTPWIGKHPTKTTIWQKHQLQKHLRVSRSSNKSITQYFQASYPVYTQYFQASYPVLLGIIPSTYPYIFRAWNLSWKWGFSRKWKSKFAEKIFFRGKTN